MLKGIDPSAEYDVTYAYDYKCSEPVRMTGAELARLEVKIDACPGSVVRASW